MDIVDDTDAHDDWLKLPDDVGVRLGDPEAVTELELTVDDEGEGDRDRTALKVGAVDTVAVADTVCVSVLCAVHDADSERDSDTVGVLEDRLVLVAVCDGEPLDVGDGVIVAVTVAVVVCTAETVAVRDVETLAVGETVGMTVREGEADPERVLAADADAVADATCDSEGCAVTDVVTLNDSVAVVDGEPV